MITHHNTIFLLNPTSDVKLITFLIELPSIVHINISNHSDVYFEKEIDIKKNFVLVQRRQAYKRKHTKRKTKSTAEESREQTEEKRGVASMQRKLAVEICDESDTHF